MSRPEADELHHALGRFLDRPSPVVVGCAPERAASAPRDFAIEVDHILRRRGSRRPVPITYVTPEPYLGHVRIGGAGKIHQFLGGEFEARDIRFRSSTAISAITDPAVLVAGGAETESRLTLVIPPLAGVEPVAATIGLANSRGLVAVDQRNRHPGHPDVYALGRAVDLTPGQETLVPVNFPKTGHITEQMAAIAASEIAARIRGGDRTAAGHPLWARCVMDRGNRGVYVTADPARPPRDRIRSLRGGRHWHWAKQAFERLSLWNARRGRLIPTALGW